MNNSQWCHFMKNKYQHDLPMSDSKNECPVVFTSKIKTYIFNTPTHHLSLDSTSQKVIWVLNVATEIVIKNNSAFYITRGSSSNQRGNITCCNKTIHRNYITWFRICRNWCNRNWKQTCNSILFVQMQSQAWIYKNVSRIRHEISVDLCSCDTTPSRISWHKAFPKTIFSNIRYCSNVD